MVQLSDRLVTLLDRQAARRGTSRSAVIRAVLEEYLAHDEEVLVSEQIVDGYRRLPPAAPDAWGDLALVTDQASVDLLSRLDAEERAAGMPPW